VQNVYGVPFFGHSVWQYKHLKLLEQIAQTDPITACWCWRHRYDCLRQVAVSWPGDAADHWSDERQRNQLGRERSQTTRASCPLSAPDRYEATPIRRRQTGSVRLQESVDLPSADCRTRVARGTRRGHRQRRQGPRCAGRRSRGADGGERNHSRWRWRGDIDDSAVPRTTVEQRSGDVKAAGKENGSVRAAQCSLAMNVNHPRHVRSRTAEVNDVDVIIDCWRRPIGLVRFKLNLNYLNFYNDVTYT